MAGSSVTSAAPFHFDGHQKNSSSNRGGAGKAGAAENEKTKIKFYSAAVNIKLGLPPQHPGKDILISDLYEKFKTMNIPNEDWNNFLKKEFGLMN